MQTRTHTDTLGKMRSSITDFEVNEIWVGSQDNKELKILLQIIFFSQNSWENIREN